MKIRAVIAGLILISLLFVACSQSTMVQQNATNAASPAATSQSYAMDISNFAFTKTPLTIHTGDTVVWTNKDSAPHTVTSDSGSELASGQLTTGQTYSHTFTTAGTYAYHCAVHPGMKATVVVQ